MQVTRRSSEETKVIQKLKAREVGAALESALANTGDLRAVPSHLAPVNPTDGAVEPPAFAVGFNDFNDLVKQ